MMKFIIWFAVTIILFTSLSAVVYHKQTAADKFSSEHEVLEDMEIEIDNKIDEMKKFFTEEK